MSIYSKEYGEVMGGGISPTFVITNIIDSFSQQIDLTKSYLYTVIHLTRNSNSVSYYDTGVYYINKGEITVVNSSSYVTVTISGNTLYGTNSYSGYMISSINQLN